MNDIPFNQLPNPNADRPDLPPEADVPDEVEVPGYFLGAILRAQCGNCGTELQATFSPPKNEEDLEQRIVCGPCTRKTSTEAGRLVKVVIPVAFLVGEDINVLDDHPDDEVVGEPVDAAPPFAGDIEVSEGTGPLVPQE